MEKLSKLELTKFLDEITLVFGPIITSKVSDVYFIYESFKNKTYQAKYKNIIVQIRIPKLENISATQEEIIANSFDDYLFYKDGYLIKKWFFGNDLTYVHIDKTITKNIIKEIKELQKLDIQLSEFNWYLNKIDDPQYDEIIKKHLNEDLVFCHNNINRSNILVNKSGKVKIIDFGNCSLNSKYVDPVMAHINLGIDRNILISEFNLDDKKFDEYIYIVKQYLKTGFEQFYIHQEIPIPKLSRALEPFQTKKYNYNSYFIIQKNKSSFKRNLNIKELDNFYFVPPYIYEDEKIIIWKWMERNHILTFNNMRIRALARAMKILHSSKVDFPKYNIEDRLKVLICSVGEQNIRQDFNSNMLNKIYKWILRLKPTSNCHNNLSINTIFFSKKQSVFLIGWENASKNDPFIDIAILFEHMQWNNDQEKLFWKTYQVKKPDNFIKYRIIVNFVAYLINKGKLDDEFLSRINKKRIYDLFYILDSKI
ncbi:hypothetical protein KQ875_01380 [Mycoplasma zalophi]|uniref:Aminoglycoside phosphotransferase domain-containing protein n=1 Tax=Mycoplasma zalophi TaxID=191287 RepID=A0ABS6DR44_9MOLU|nr:hypothetical protein [Mycoplasma zalophi]MBU4692246.1 hypothetical protein [Mycoplasma zalophi]